MANVAVKVHTSGANDVRNSPEVQAFLLALAQEIARKSSANGVNAQADVRPGRTRAHARAYIADAASDMKNKKTNALLKSMDFTNAKKKLAKQKKAKNA